MDFLKIRSRRKTVASQVVYIGLNLALPIIILILVRTTGSMVLPVIFVILSKWRTLAVRPRYWLANLQTNMVDLIVGLSVAISMVLVNNANASFYGILIFQIILAIFYAVWLLVIKPRSKRSYVIIQAGIALFMGTITIFSALSYWAPSFVVVVLMWGLGYLTARHVLTSFKEKQIALLSFIYGFYMAQLAWLAYHWTIAYSLPFFSFIKVPQVAIIITLVSFVLLSFYNSFYKHKKVRLNDVLLPTVFSLLTILVLLMFFDNITFIL